MDTFPIVKRQDEAPHRELELGALRCRDPLRWDPDLSPVNGGHIRLTTGSPSLGTYGSPIRTVHGIRSDLGEQQLAHTPNKPSLSSTTPIITTCVSGFGSAAPAGMARLQHAPPRGGGFVGECLPAGAGPAMSLDRSLSPEGP